MTYEAALAWVAASRNRGVRPGLSRISRLLTLLGNPQEASPVIHVAGTNGKGSTCACLEAGLRACGLRTGMFISPWLLHVREMFRLDGEPVGEELFVHAATAVSAAEARMPASDLPTEYELYAAMAFWVFREAGCDVQVLETCMGGRFDTTNAYGMGNLAVLSRIDMDHTAFLGDTLRDIAWHKAGILRPRCAAVSVPQQAEAAAVLRQCAEQTRTALSFLPEGAVSAVRPSTDVTRFKLLLPDATDGDNWSGDWAVSLAGDYQAENAALAVAALHRFGRWQPQLGITPEAVRRGLRQVRWPCRFEVFAGDPVVVIDGAHNPDGMRRFAGAFQQLFPGRRAVVVLGVLGDKDVAGMRAPLLEITDTLHLIRPGSPRGMPVDELAARLFSPGSRESATGRPESADGTRESAAKASESAAGTPESACCIWYKHDTIQAAMVAGLQDAGPDGILVAVGSLSWTGVFRQLYLEWKTGSQASGVHALHGG